MTPLRSLHCPACAAALEPCPEQVTCAACGSAFPLVHGIPVFGDRAEVEEWTSYYTDASRAERIAGGGYVGDAPSADNAYYSRFLPGGASLVLDAGGGDGNTTSEWARRHPQSSVFVMDLSLHGLLRLGRRALPNMHPLCAATDRRFPFSDDQFDVVNTVFMVEHMPPDALDRFLAESHRVLKPGGRLVVASDSPFYDAVLHPLERLVRQRKYVANDPTHINLMTPRTCEAIVRRHTFEVRERVVHWVAGRHAPARLLYRLLPGALAEALFSTMYVLVAEKPVATA